MGRGACTCVQMAKYSMSLITPQTSSGSIAFLPGASRCGSDRHRRRRCATPGRLGCVCKCRVRKGRVWAGVAFSRARVLSLTSTPTCSSLGGVILTMAKDPIDAGPASSAAECLRRPPHTLVRLGRRVVQSPRWARFARLQRRVGVVVLNVLRRGILVGGTDRPLVVLPPAVPPRGLLLRWKLQGAIAAASAAPGPHPHPVLPSKAAPSWAVCRFGKARDAVLLPNLWVARRQQHIARHCSLRGGSTDVPARGRRFALDLRR